MANPSAQSLSPEARLLFRLAQEPIYDAVVGALIHQPLDWGRLMRLAQREKALGLVAEQIGAKLAPPLPDGAAAIRRVAMLTTFHLLHLEQRLQQTVAALNEAEIPVALLKGAGLAYTAYPSFTARQMADLDLLVHGSDARRAQGVLRAIGWQAPEEPDTAEFYAGHHHLPPMHDSRVKSATLELHTELFIAGHPLGLTGEAVWAEARPVQVGATRAFVPHPHHQLLHACLHFAWGHGMQSGAWRTFRDVAAIVRTGAVDWDGFVALAESGRGQSCCYWTFELARVLAGLSSVPPAVLARLRPPHSRVVHDRIRRHLALTLLPSESVSPSVRLDRFIWEAAIMPDHYGHGVTRPWALEDRMVGDAQAATGGRPNRLVAGLHKVGAYGRYLRTMLTR